MNGRRAAIASLLAALAVRTVVAPLRTLSADEAYYLYASRRGFPWPIRDHPPLLGALLSLADRVSVGPLELRVRWVAVVLQLCTALAVARLAARSTDVEPERAASTAMMLATWGLMPTAGALLATPDAPLLCALAWMLALTIEGRTVARDLGVAAFAAAAVLSKAAALPVIGVVVVVHASRRSWRVAVAAAIGALVASPFAWASLRPQIEHALGRGALVSAPRVGAAAAFGALVVGQLLLWSPPLVVVGARALARRSSFVADRALAVVVLAAAAFSAVASGRPPEPNWPSPAALPLLVAAAIALVDRPQLRRWVVGLAAAPAIVALAAWIAPLDRGPFARVPHRSAGPPADAPPYGVAAWRCIYEARCEEIDAMTKR